MVSGWLVPLASDAEEPAHVPAQRRVVLIVDRPDIRLGEGDALVACVLTAILKLLILELDRSELGRRDDLPPAFDTAPLTHRSGQPCIHEVERRVEERGDPPFRKWADAQMSEQRLGALVLGDVLLSRRHLASPTSPGARFGAHP